MKHKNLFIILLLFSLFLLCSFRLFYIYQKIQNCTEEDIYLLDNQDCIITNDKIQRIIVENENAIQIIENNIHPLKTGDSFVKIVDKNFDTVKYNLHVQEYQNPIKLNNELFVGDIVDLTEDSVFPINYQSSDNQIIEITQNNNLKVLSDGSCLITKTVNNYRNLIYEFVIEKPQINETELTLYNGDKKKLEISNCNTSINWSSTDKEVVSVDNEGNIQALKDGKAIIEASFINYTLTCDVTVMKDPEIYGKSQMLLGETQTLKTKNKIGNVTFSSSNEKILSVTNSGKIKALGVGKATIFVKVQNKTINYDITVISPSFDVEELTLEVGSHKVITLNDFSGKIDWSIDNSDVAIFGNGDSPIINSPYPTIKKTIDWATNIANDNTHGYNNNKNLIRPEDYNCIELVLTAYEKANIPIWDSCNIYGTVNMDPELLKVGFISVINDVNVNTGEGLEPGDILVAYDEGKTSHTEMYIGNGMLVGARGDDDGQPGDSGGGEIAISGYSNMGWNHVLRYKGNSLVDPYIDESTLQENQVIITGMNSGTCNLTATIQDYSITIPIVVN